MAGEQINLAILRRVAIVCSKLNRGGDLEDTLQAVADGVVEALGFGAAVVNYRFEKDTFQVMAAAGPEDMCQKMLGAKTPLAEMENALAEAEVRGELHYLRHLVTTCPTWVHDFEPSSDPDSWHPDDALLLPMRGTDGTLLGVLSVDLPPGLRFPSPVLGEMLEIFAGAASIAIEQSRLVSEVRREHSRLIASEAAFRFAFTGSGGAMAMLSLDPDRVGVFEQANDAFCATVGYTEAELTRMSWSDLVVPEQRESCETNLHAFACNRSGSHRGEDQIIRRDGKVIWCKSTCTVISATQVDVDPFVLTHLEDVTERKDKEASLVREARMDTLTGLANRRRLLEHLSALLTTSNGNVPEQTEPIGYLFYTDLNLFKRVNDRYGHLVGDIVLREAAQRLRTAVRRDDFVARLGGDEFVVVTDDIDEEAAQQLADRIHQVFAKPLTAVDETVTISLGFSALRRGDDPVSSLHDADLRMYADKLHHQASSSLTRDG